jgi:mRNA interferase RelE/StbE
MKYELFLTNTFIKNFQKLPPKIQGKVKDILKLIQDDPFIEKKLTGDLKGEFSFRIREYRIIYCLQKNKVYLEAIGHRREVYKKAK